MASTLHALLNTGSASIRRLPILWVGLLLGIHAALWIHSAQLKSATFDEPINLFYGIHMLETGDWTVPVDYGPLPRLAPALFLKASGYGVFYSPEEISWVPGIQPALAQEVLYLQNGGDALIQRARWILLPLSLLLGLAIHRTASALWGGLGGLASLFAWAFSPSLLAHSRLLTSDFPVAAFLFFTLILVLPENRRWSILRYAAGGLCLGLAMLSKVSACFLVPILLLHWAYRGWSPREASWRPWTREVRLDTRRKRVVRAALALALIGLGAALTVWAFYGFRYATYASDDPRAEEKSLRLEELRREKPLESALFERVLDLSERTRILPEPYLLTLRYSLHHMQRRLSYFMGERSVEGFPLYFPTALLIKTPLPLLLLLLLAWPQFRSLRSDHRALFLFPLLYLAYTLTANINIGHRYLLPLYPFLMVFVGGAMVSAVRWKKSLAALALVLLGLTSLWIHPDPLTYFNALAGGPRGGIQWLGDSSLDWGQDLGRLPGWMEENGVDRVHLGYFGTAVPESYGFEFDWLPSVGFRNDRRPSRVTLKPGDILVVSATCLQGFYFEDPTFYHFLDGWEPLEVIGNTLYIFRVPDPPTLNPSS